MITYGELTGFCREAIVGLPDRSLIVCLCKNSIGSVAGYAAVMSAGCVPLMVDADVDDGMLNKLLDTYQPEYIWLPIDRTKKADAATATYKDTIIATGTTSEALAKRDEETARQIAEAKVNASKKASSSRVGTETAVTNEIVGEIRMDRYGYDLVRLKPIEEIKRLAAMPSAKELENGDRPRLHPELALLMMTRGTTGDPKVVRLSDENVFINAAAIVDYLEIGEFDRAITTLPMSHNYGLSVINSHLLAGAELLLTDMSVTKKEFWDFFNREKATSFAGDADVYEKLDSIDFDKKLLPSLKYMTQSGRGFSKELHKKYAELAEIWRKRFYVMYGQTEATARMAYVPYMRSAEKAGSIGVAIPGGALSLEDEQGREITEPHVSGELVYRGSNVTFGYATELSDLCKGDENEGVLHTGDMAEMDEDGYFFIVGRKKRFLKIYGNRVSLDECEDLIEKHFQIECACTGEDDEMHVFVTGKVGDSVIVEYLAGKTGLNPAAFTVKTVEKIPRSGSGKKAYGELA
ncbi:MAG: AMP-binding protein [Eubacterium sp.]|nr:AMP-binding protein [Eubacterium sp.]